MSADAGGRRANVSGRSGHAVIGSLLEIAAYVRVRCRHLSELRASTGTLYPPVRSIRRQPLRPGRCLGAITI
jgi:hypothetical protein